ncbi:MAG: hypothetical protein ACHQ50_13240 [Fimbriimonadales bacterium]
MKRATFPRPEEGDQVVVIDGSGPPVSPEPPPPEVLAQIDFEKDPDNLIRVSEETGRYHPLVRATRESLTQLRMDHKRGIMWSGPGTLSLRVSSASKARALRILDTLVRSCEKRGFEVLASAPTAQAASTIIKVHGEDVSLTLEERCRSVDHVLTAAEKKEVARGGGPWIQKHDMVPSGLLVLQIDHVFSKTTWKDNSKRQIETCLNDVMVALVQMAIQVVRPHRLKREVEEREWKARAKRGAIERRRRELLEEATKKWRYVHSLDEFLTALRAAMAGAGIDPDGATAQAEWLRWACTYRERVDPFAELFAEIEKPISSWYWER